MVKSGSLEERGSAVCSVLTLQEVCVRGGTIPDSAQSDIVIHSSVSFSLNFIST
jgi:hypothetical protein